MLTPQGAHHSLPERPAGRGARLRGPDPLRRDFRRRPWAPLKERWTTPARAIKSSLCDWFGARGVPDRDVDRRSRHGGSVCREADQPFAEAFAGALAGLWPQPSRSARHQARRHRRRIAAVDFRLRRTRRALVDYKSIRCPFILDNRFYLDNILWSVATSRAARSNRRLRSSRPFGNGRKIFRRSLQ